MTPHMFLQIKASGETFTTNRADKGLLSRVNPHVRFKVKVLRKDLLTDTTFEGFLSCVNQCVPLQIRLQPESLATVRAAVRLVLSVQNSRIQSSLLHVSPQMQLQIDPVCEGHLATRTHEVCKRLMLNEFGVDCEALSAHITDEGTLTSVDKHVTA